MTRTPTNRLRAFLRAASRPDRGNTLPAVMTASHPAWAPVWNHLAAIQFNADLPDPRGAAYQGECWQLLDNWSDGPGSGTVTFRHRCHPVTRAREYVHVWWVRVVGNTNTTIMTKTRTYPGGGS